MSTTVRSWSASAGPSASTNARGVRIDSVTGPETDGVISAKPTPKTPSYLALTGWSRSVISMSSTSTLTGSKATVWPGGRRDSSPSVTVARCSPSARMAISVIQRFGGTAGFSATCGCSRTISSITVGDGYVSRMTSPRASENAATAQRVSMSPSAAYTARSAGMNVTGLPYAVAATA